MSRKSRRDWVTAALPIFLAGATGCRLASTASGHASGVQITDHGDRLRIEVGGEPFMEYWYRDVPKPYLYPVLGPGGLPVTRNWPMKEAPEEERDHKHHRSIWFTHGAVNSQDFWSEEAKAGRIEHEGFSEVRSGEKVGLVRSRDRWRANDGSIICRDERTLRVYRRPDVRIFDFEITLHAVSGQVTFGDTKEGTLGMRVAETMRLKGKVGRGHIVNSDGVRDEATWGKRAAWCDYYGPVLGQTVGVAIFDHPANLRHPTWWHVRDYGLFAANPFGIHDFEKKPAGTGDYTLPSGQSFTLRYRFVLHRGDEQQARIAELYREYAAAN
jgi:hypothetical protein